MATSHTRKNRDPKLDKFGGSGVSSASNWPEITPAYYLGVSSFAI
jgi:hypothetical protein